MKPAELIGKTADQLREQVLSLKKEQFNLRFQKATGQLENSSRVRQVRRVRLQLANLSPIEDEAQPEQLRLL